MAVWHPASLRDSLAFEIDSSRPVDASHRPGRLKPYPAANTFVHNAWSWQIDFGTSAWSTSHGSSPRGTNHPGRHIVMRDHDPFLASADYSCIMLLVSLPVALHHLRISRPGTIG